MELKEAIEVVKNIDTTDIYCKNCVLEEKDKCITDLFGYSCQRIAIDTVLEELNNRIPRKEIEDKIEKVRCETTWNYNDWKYDEKVYNAEHNMINIIEKELLNKE